MSRLIDNSDKISTAKFTEILWARIVQFYPTFSELHMHITVDKEKHSIG